MGNYLKSNCRTCNYKNEFKFGGTRFNYSTNFPVPAINKKTLEFENVNYYEVINSDKYIFYFNDELKDKNGKNKTFSNFELELNEKNNYCPTCKNQTLDFQITLYY
jgi:hypothetical protein